MTAYDPQSDPGPYQPPVKKSSRTFAWGVGRAIVWFVYAFALVAIVIATLAFVLQLFGADPNNGFAQWVYRSAARVTAPFRGIFPSHVNGNSVLDVSLLFAIIMYALFAVFVPRSSTSSTVGVTNPSAETVTTSSRPRSGRRSPGRRSPGRSRWIRPLQVAVTEHVVGGEPSRECDEVGGDELLGEDRGHRDGFGHPGGGERAGEADDRNERVATRHRDQRRDGSDDDVHDEQWPVADVAAVRLHARVETEC